MKLINERGSAILTSLFIMILVAIAATAMSLRLQIDISRTQIIEDMHRLKEAAHNETLTVMSKLLENGKRYHPTQQQYIDSPLSYKNNTPQTHIQVGVHLYDLQSRFNINNLVQVGFIKPFAQLLQNQLQKLSTKDAYQLSHAVHHWCSPINLKRRDLALEQYYQQQSPAYVAAHRPLIAVSELRLIKGFNPSRILNLQPYLAALPSVTPINIMTAPLPVLRTLGAGLTKEQAKSLIEVRSQQRIKSLAEFLNLPAIKKLNLQAKSLTLTSQYFLIRVDATRDHRTLSLFTYVKRIIKKNQVHMQVLQQFINTPD